MNETQQQVIDWLANGRKGMSSECMAMWLGFGKRVDDGFGPAHPHDPADFDRCLGSCIKRHACVNHYH